MLSARFIGSGPRRRAQLLPQVTAGDVLADEERPAVLFADVVHGDDVGVVEARHRPGLAAHPLQVVRFQQFGPDEGQCTIAVECRVLDDKNGLLPS
jgi:hypothetical protein